MSEGESGKTVFSGSVNAKNIQTGENASIHEGDIVSGDKVQGQQVAGDMTVDGDVNQTFGDSSPINPVVDFVNKLEESFQSEVADPLFAQAPPMAAEASLGEAEFDLNLDEPLDFDNGVSDIDPLDDEIPALGEPTADAVFGDLKKAAAMSESEIESDPKKKSFIGSAITGFKDFAMRCAPRTGEAMLAGATAAIQATIRTHPVVAGVLATLEVFRKA